MNDEQVIAEIKKRIDTIDEDVKKTPVILYMKGTKDMPQCGFSNQVVHILNETGATYEAKNVLEDDFLREGIKQYSDWPTIPQLYVKGEFIGGCDIVTELYENGELQTLLKQEH